MMDLTDTLLPVLRKDLQLNEAPPDSDGAPTWTLYDPAANKYYKIGWLEFECLVRFGQCQTAKQLAQLVARETTLDPEEDTIRRLVMFLAVNHLVQAPGEGVADHFETQRRQAERPLWQKAIHSYLFLMIPLFRPQTFLKKTYPLVKPLFTRYFMALVVLLLSYGIFISIQRFDEIQTTFMSYLSFEGVVLFLLTTIIVKVIHELGHAYTATKYDVPVTVIGVALIVLYPVLYTETTNAWKMRSRRDRLIIAGGGMMAEMALASVAIIAWHMLPPGMLQSLCFMVGIVSLGASLVVNLNPLMRFDGYYLFSDFVGVDNLQDRSFAFAKWRLRSALWGWKDPAPEFVTKDLERLLTGFGFAIWIYRFSLYLGIGLLVYHLFFQPLGLILMFVELGFFITMPIVREVKVWVERAPEIIKSGRGRTVMALGVLALLLAVLPVNSSIQVPAVMHAEKYMRFYTPISAKMEEIAVERGQKVSEGDLLFRLSSPELDYNIRIVQSRLDNLIEIRNAGQASQELSRKRLTIGNEIELAEQELAGYVQIKEKLSIRAPFDGIVHDVDSSLHAGQWIGSDILLGVLVDPDAVKFSGYVNEQDARRVSDLRSGLFYPEFSAVKKYPVVLRQVGQTSVNDIFWTELSSLHGGQVPSERGHGGEIRPLPRYTFYTAEFEGVKIDAASIPDFIARGAVRLDAAPHSFAKLLLEKTISYFSGGSES